MNKTTTHRRERNGVEYTIEIRYYEEEKIAPYTYWGDCYEYIVYRLEGYDWPRNLGTPVEICRHGYYQRKDECYIEAQKAWEMFA